MHCRLLSDAFVACMFEQEACDTVQPSRFAAGVMALHLGTALNAAYRLTHSLHQKELVRHTHISGVQCCTHESQGLLCGSLRVQDLQYAVNSHGGQQGGVLRNNFA